ncbi:MAG: T9SS type A sorting domain-containing protein [Flavobacteriales bacterium]
MNKFFPILSFFFLLSGSVTAQLTHLSVEEINHTGIVGTYDLTGYTTYRIFAHTSSSDDNVVHVAGNEGNCESYVRTTSEGWFNSAFGGNTGSSISEFAWDIEESSLYDTYVTIGMVSAGSLGVPISENENGLIPLIGSGSVSLLGDAAQEFAQEMATGISGGNLELGGFFGSSWFSIPDNPNTEPQGFQNSVLLGQFTTNGIFSFALNVQVLGENQTESSGMHYWCQSSAMPGMTFVSHPNCNDESACNYSVESNSNAQCIYIGDACDDLNPFTNTDFIDELCECIGINTGCMNELACNYDPDAIEDDGSCAYANEPCEAGTASIYTEECACESTAFGVVFNDMNSNGVYDEGDYPIPNQSVTLVNEGISQFTNSLGIFYFDDLTGSEYTVAVDYTLSWLSYSTTPVTQNITLPQSLNEPVYFGLSHDPLSPSAGYATLNQNGLGIPCNDVLPLTLLSINGSPHPIDGVLELVLDPLVTYSSASVEPDGINGQTLTWFYDQLMPLNLASIDLFIETPSEEFIGDQLEMEVNFYSQENGTNVLLSQQDYSYTITCAYDPNDITAIPEGYTDEHWVLEDTRMEYMIRFQNTGNAPATDVLVLDTLDVNMDPATFSVLASSHNMSTTLYPSGRVEFLFENINLPDSSSNLEESQGFLKFNVEFNENLAVGEEINQTGYIYFDNNPPIITNTTWHTIHECGGEAAFETSVTEICVGETVEFTSTYPHLEEYSWIIGLNEEGTEAALSHTFTEAGTYEVQFTGENPICAENTSQTITVFDIPTVTISQNGDLLTSSEGDAYQWFLNGELIEGAVNQEYSVLEDGTYTVEVTNGGLCTGTSEGVMVVNIAELEGETILLYPNPMADRAFLEFEDASVRTIRLMDSSGKEVRVWNSVATRNIEINREELAAGNYVISVESNGKLERLQLVIR